MQTIAATIATIVVFLGLDAIWLKTFIGPFFRERIGHMMREDPLIGVAAGFYAIFAIGIVYFAVQPALAAGNLWLAIMNGAFLGFLAYGTYEATSMAIMKDWQYSMLAIDIAWGTFVCGVSAAAGYLAAKAVAGT